jgi:hypothetical protein
MPENWAHYSFREKEITNSQRNVDTTVSDLAQENPERESLKASRAHVSRYQHFYGTTRPLNRPYCNLTSVLEVGTSLKVSRYPNRERKQNSPTEEKGYYKSL